METLRELEFWEKPLDFSLQLGIFQKTSYRENVKKS
jgi:hypothetical protein